MLSGIVKSGSSFLALGLSLFICGSVWAQANTLIIPQVNAFITPQVNPTLAPPAPAQPLIFKGTAEMFEGQVSPIVIQVTPIETAVSAGPQPDTSNIFSVRIYFSESVYVDFPQAVWDPASASLDAVVDFNTYGRMGVSAQMTCKGFMWTETKKPFSCDYSSTRSTVIHILNIMQTP